MKKNKTNKNIEAKQRKRKTKTKTKNIYPIGYQDNPLTGVMEFDEVTAPKIRILFNMLAKEMPSDEVLINVINMFFEDGFLGVYSTIQNPFYCGIIEKNGFLYQGIHTPLVSIQTWEMANENLGKILDRLLKPIAFYRQAVMKFSENTQEDSKNKNLRDLK